MGVQKLLSRPVSIYNVDLNRDQYYDLVITDGYGRKNVYFGQENLKFQKIDYDKLTLEQKKTIENLVSH